MAQGKNHSQKGKKERTQMHLSVAPELLADLTGVTVAKAVFTQLRESPV
jgi:hypothetical protein